MPSAVGEIAQQPRGLLVGGVHIEGALHIVRVASAALVKPAEFRYVRGELHLN